MAEEFDAPMLPELLYNSTIIMMMRRLLANGEWYRNRYENTNFEPEEKFEKEYLRYYLSFSAGDARQLATLIFRALDSSRQKISITTRRKIKAHGERQQMPCEICGREIDYQTEENPPNKFSIDHIWPSSLGGTSEESNLRIACKICNDYRQNTVNTADSHYEHMHVHIEEDDESFLNQFDNRFRLAVLMKTDSTCEYCGKPVASRPDNTNFDTRSKAENHNIFNTITVCSACSRDY
jgi:NAD-dependent SIR2 family protein deacetylase